jgi:hypothetical protein
MLCVAQKSSISWVSRMPPITDPAIQNQWKGLQRRRLIRSPHKNHGSVGFEQVHIGIVVMRCGDGIKDKIKVPLQSGKRLGL